MATLRRARGPSLVNLQDSTSVESVTNPRDPRTQLADARDRLRNLLQESRKTLEKTNTIPSTPHYCFQYTPAPRNVTVSVKTYNPRGENDDPLFFPIIAESRHRRTLRSCVTVIEITSKDEEEEEEAEAQEPTKEEQTTPEKESTAKTDEVADTQSSSDGEEKPKKIEKNETDSKETKAQPAEKKTKPEGAEDSEESSDEIIVPSIPKAPTTWPELPKKVDPESVKTAQDKEWWDDEILRVAIAQLKAEELEPEQTEGVLVYSPLEAISLLYHGEIESPPANIKRIFMPLHVDGTHWCLLEMSASSDKQTLFVTLFDSLPILNTAEWFQFRWQEVNRAIEGLARCKVFGKLGWRAKNVEIARVDRRQTNIYDCGPYTVEFLKKRINNEKGDTVSAFEAAMRRETVKEWLESDEVDVPLTKAEQERIKAETEVIKPNAQVAQVKSRIRGRLSAIFDS